MTAQLPQDSNISPQVYELATSHGVGTPLKRQNRKLVQILLIAFCESSFYIYEMRLL